MSPADKLLSRLERVKRTGPGRWIARCPTRDDRSPSLSIRELEDGRLLVHDFGGDDVATIMAAVGLDTADLFPARLSQIGQAVKRPFNASDVLALMAFEASVAFVICSDVLRTGAVSNLELSRLLTAARRLGDAAEVCHANS